MWLKIKRALGKPMWFDRWIYRAQQVLLMIVTVALSVTIAVAAADKQWPYEVVTRKLLTQTVEPGGQITMHRVIEYRNADCWRSYDRRAVTKTGSGRQFRFQKVVDERLPVELSGKPQEWTENLPDDFPCGPAYLVETVTAACSLWQRYFSKLTKPDIITPFDVKGCS